MINTLEVKDLSSVEIQIVDLFNRHDNSSIDLINEHYGINLNILAYQIVKDYDVAKDVIQDTLVKIWKHYKRYDASKGRLYTWLRNIVRNTALDKLKTINRKRDMVLRDELSVVDNFKVNTFNVDVIDLVENLNKLKEKNRVVLDLSYMQGFTQDIIAEKLGIPLGTVKSRIRIGLREMKKMYGIKISH